ncbi:Sorbose reductase SOU1 [Mycena kentingensis (nom. inval.)]|nr:Sorbose reductase SOU1 [Mycena kentingensis (nom. inval.)]
MPNQGVASALAGHQPTPTALSLFTLPNRVALVTGAQRGIGLEFALALAEAGAVVYCIDLPKEPDTAWGKVQTYAAQLGAGAGRLEYMSCDVTDQDAIWALAEEIVQKEGRLDVCMANAGIIHVAGCLDHKAEDFNKVLDVNVSGAFYTAQAAARQMDKLGIQGSIVLTASMSGTITNRGQDMVAYNTSKSAVLQMARSMACELAPKGIRVNSISPGYIFSEMTKLAFLSQPGLEEELSAQNPLGRFGRPDELRGVALWLASDASSFCTGTDIRVDGGQCAW